MGAGRAQGEGPFVHKGHEGFACSGEVLASGYGGVVAGAQEQAGEQFAEGNGLTGVEVHG
jgi:hypothetical protein